MASNDVVLDLDAVVAERVTIKKIMPATGEQREWHLWDDVPPQIMLRAFRMMANSQRAGKVIGQMRDEVDPQDEDAIEAATLKIEQLLADQDEEALNIALSIFQHTYPETTAEDLRSWFNRKAIEEIVKLFFFRQFSASSQLSNSTTPEPTTSPEAMAEAGANPNRATRRHSRPSAGAIPSQKRIKRELGGSF